MSAVTSTSGPWGLNTSNSMQSAVQGYVVPSLAAACCQGEVCMLIAQSGVQ